MTLFTNGNDWVHNDWSHKDWLHKVAINYCEKHKISPPNDNDAFDSNEKFLAFFIARGIIIKTNNTDSWPKHYFPASAFVSFGFCSGGWPHEGVKFKKIQTVQASLILKDAIQTCVALQALHLPALLLYEITAAVTQPFSNLLNFNFMWLIATSSKHYIEKRMCLVCNLRAKQVLIMPCKHYFCTQCAGIMIQRKKCDTCQGAAKIAVFQMKKYFNHSRVRSIRHPPSGPYVEQVPF